MCIQYLHVRKSYNLLALTSNYVSVKCLSMVHSFGYRNFRAFVDDAQEKQDRPSPKHQWQKEN